MSVQTAPPDVSLQVFIALRHLSDMEREVVIERVIREQEYVDIALTVGCCEKSARDTFQRAMKKLRYHLEPIREEL